MSALSIPGTHDSAAYTTTWPFISTQNMDIKSQLYAGIRYFDLRCGAIKDALEMVHGAATLGLPLADVLDTMYDYLRKHPREALIVQLKQDRKDEGSTRAFADLVVETLAQDAQYWRTDCTTPTLGELRGRIQLLRRFTANNNNNNKNNSKDRSDNNTTPNARSSDNIHAYGINVSRWQDNPATPFTIHTYSGVHLTIQDHYSFSTPETLPNLIVKKGGDVADMLARAARDPQPWHWYINFSSAFEINVYHQLNPREIALGGYHFFRWVEGINLRLCNTLVLEKGIVEGRRRRLGVVVMDFPELPVGEALVQCVVDSNFDVPVERVGEWRWGWGRCRVRFVLVVVGLLLLLLLLLLSFGGGGSWSGVERLFMPVWLENRI